MQRELYGFSCWASVYKWASVFPKLIGELIRDHKHYIV